MLGAGSHVIGTEVVGVVALIAFDFGFHHARINYGVLAEAFPNASPARITAEVNHGIVYPRAVSGTAFVGSDFSTGACQFSIERCGYVDGLREQRASLCIGDAVVVVQTVDVGDTDMLHRLLLYQPNPLLPLFDGGGAGAWRIEDGAHFPFRDERVEHLLVQFPHALGVALIDVDGIVAQLVNNLLVAFLEQIIDFLWRGTKLLEHLAHLVAVNLDVLHRHLAHHVEVQFQHLADFLVECHAL